MTNIRVGTGRIYFKPEGAKAYIPLGETQSFGRVTDMLAASERRPSLMDSASILAIEVAQQ